MSDVFPCGAYRTGDSTIAVGGVLLTLVLGSARILQLRHTVRRPR